MQHPHVSSLPAPYSIKRWGQKETKLRVWPILLWPLLTAHLSLSVAEQTLCGLPDRYSIQGDISQRDALREGQ